MASLTVALVLGCALGLLVAGNRWLGILGAALLCFLFPVPFSIGLLVLGLAYLLFTHFGNY